jgi:iron complex outermembrane recepter protein
MWFGVKNKRKSPFDFLCFTNLPERDLAYLIIMKNSIILILLCLCATLGLAQTTIKGSVKNSATGEVLAGTNVAVVGTGRGATTDINGNFEIKNIQAGSYTLRASYLGFESATLQFTVPSNSNLEIQLEPGSLLTEEFIVYATRATDRTPMTFQQIIKSEITKRNLGQDIPILLNFTPSVVSYSDAGAGIGYTGLRIRGSDPTRINVTVNGIPLNDAESHGVWWVNMPDFASSVDNIQIQRGVGTSTNGAATFGASLNIQTDTRSDEPYAEIDNAVGSFNTRRNTVKFGTGLINNRWAMDGRLSRITSDGFIDRAFSDMSSYFLSGGYYGDKHVFKINVFAGDQTVYQAWEGVPEALLKTNRTFNPYTYDNQTDNYKQDHFQFIYTGDLSAHWKANVAFHYTYGRGYYEQYRPNDRLSRYGLQPISINGTLISRTDIIRRRWLDNDFYGAVFSFNYNSSDEKLDLSFGGGANRYDGDHFGEIIWMREAGPTQIRDRYYDNNAVKDDLNLYAKATYEIKNNLFAFGDLQLRSIDYRMVGINNDLRDVTGDFQYRFFNPKFGLTYESPSGKTLYASYAVANREPVRRDFTDSPLTETPRPERLQNIEAGVRISKSQFSYNANFFYMNYKDQLVLTGQLNDVGSYIRENVANSYRAGVELDGAYRLTEKWTLAGNVTFSRNKIEAFTEYVDDYSAPVFTQVAIPHTDTDIAFSPNVVSAAIVDFRPFKNFEINFLTKYVSRQFLDNTQNEARSLNPFLTNDLQFNYSFRPRFVKQMEFSLLVNNIFNQMYEPNGYTFSYFVASQGLGERELVTENFFYPQAGTNFLARVRILF